MFNKSYSLSLSLSLSLLGKVEMRFAEINKSCTYSTQALIELCGIRDGTIQCNILNQKEVCALIDVLSTE